MRINVFLDGRPGHEKQSLGIIAALKRGCDVEVTEIPVQHQSIGRHLIALFKLFFFRDGGCTHLLPPADLLLGTGSRTHLALLSCKKKYNIPAVTCMAPDMLLRSRFDLCFVPRHDAIPAADNIFLTTGPPNMSVLHSEKDLRCGLILIGGVDKDSHVWENGKLQLYIERIVGKEPTVQWNISSSPRTPAETVASLQMLADNLSNCTFYRFEDTPQGWVEQQYAESDIVWVTADSMSMVYEALTAGCKVGIMPVQWKQKGNKFQKSGDYLFERGLAVSYSMWVEGSMQWSEGAALNEAERCASEILKRWL